ncbi:MAG: PocR ligand-binding domain-containing protein [Lachnospiraceae bacterium]
MEYMQKLHQLAKVYYESTQISLSTLDADGQMLSQVGDTCRFCQMLNELAGEKSEICQYWHQHGGKQAAELDEDYIYACPAGMILFAVGLNWDGKYQGSVLAGPILIEYPDITFVDDTLLRLNLPPTGRTALFSALGSVTIVDPKRAKYLSQLLYMLLEHDFSRNNSRKQEQGEQQARISEYLQAIDFTYEDGAGQYELDSELQLYMQLGDRDNARKEIDKLLSKLYLTSGMQLEILRSHIIAYVALLSRWAVEAGANAEEMYRLTNKGLKQLVDVSSHDQISLFLQDYMEECMNLLYQPEIQKVSSVIHKGLHYIHQHYKSNISLDEAANSVGLSSPYFSTLFKKETGVSFTTYVNTIRVNAAKRLLRDTNMAMVDIALTLGFGSQSYFTSAFKKITGVNPGKYRSERTSTSTAKEHSDIDGN